MIDKSALARLGSADESLLWLERIERGLVLVSMVTRLEVGFSARSGADFRRAMSRGVMAAMLTEHLTPRIEERALEVQRLLAERGEHRAPSVPDLLIAATAELCGHTVLHVDKDFEVIADVTQQPTQRLRTTD